MHFYFKMNEHKLKIGFLYLVKFNLDIVCFIKKKYKIK